MLIFPHHTLSSVILSFTIKRSFGDLPVNSPVFTAKAPEDASTPCPLAMVMS